MTSVVQTDRASGFTLAELLIVLAVIGIVAGVVVPAAINLSPSQALAAARFIAADLRYVRSRAVVLGRPLTVRFDLSAQQYTVSDADGVIMHPWAGSERFEGKFVVSLNKGTPFPGVRMESADFGGRNWFSFGPLGDPVDCGTLTVRQGRATAVVRVEPGTGLVRVTQ